MPWRGLVPAEGLLGLRPRPFGAASGLRPTAFNLGSAQVVEPFLFYVGGSTNMPFGAKSRSTIPHRKTYALFNQPPVKPARCNPRTRVGTLRVAFQMIPVL